MRGHTDLLGGLMKFRKITVAVPKDDCSSCGFIAGIAELFCTLFNEEILNAGKPCDQCLSCTISEEEEPD